MLQQFQEIPDAWTKVDTIMEQSSSQQTKFLALGVCAALLSVLIFVRSTLPLRMPGLLPLYAKCDILPVMVQHPHMRASTGRLPAEHAPGSSTVFKQVSGRHDVATEQATGHGLRVTLQVQIQVCLCADPREHNKVQMGSPAR